MNGQNSEYLPCIKPPPRAVYSAYEILINQQVQSQNSAHDYQRMNAGTPLPTRAHFTAVDGSHCSTGRVSWLPIVVSHPSALEKSNTSNLEAVNGRMQHLQKREIRSKADLAFQRGFKQIPANSSTELDKSKMTHVLMLAPGNQKHATSNQYHGQTGTQPVPQSYKNHIVLLNSPSLGQTLCASGMNQKICQCSGQINSASNHGKGDSINSNSNYSQLEPRHISATASEPPVTPFPEAQKESPLSSEQKKDTQSSTPSDPNTQEIGTFFKSTNSIPPSPHHTAPKVVCVVQPLSQESCTVPSQNTSLNKVNQEAENYKAPNSSERKNSCRAFLKIPNPSPSSWDPVSSSDSPVFQHFPQKKLCTDESGSKPAVDIQKNHQVVPTSEEPESGCGHNDASELPLDPKSFELSTIPAIQWKAEALTQLIQDCVRVELEPKTITPFKAFIEMFWDGNGKKLVSQLRSCWYSKLLANVNKFFIRHVTQDTIVLSEVKKEHLSHLHILENDEVYEAPPYTSSWLNLNEQLDDIDKEFGFPLSLRAHQEAPESICKEDRVLAVKKVSVEMESKEQNKALPETELEPEETKENQTSAVEVTPTQNTSPAITENSDSRDKYYSFEIRVLDPEAARIIFEENKQGLPVKVPSVETSCNNTECADSSDESCSFAIEVLSPEEAKLIFEGAQNMMSQYRDTDTSAGMDSDFIDLTSDSTKSRTPPKIKNCLRCNKPLFSKCKSTTEDLTPEKEGNLEPENWQLAVRPKNKCHEEEESQDKDGEDLKNEIPIHRWQEEVVDITDMDDDQDSIILISEDDEVSSKEINSRNLLSDHHEDRGEESSESGDPTSSALNGEHQNSKKMLHLREDWGRAALTPSLADKEEFQNRKRKKQCHNTKLALGNKMKKHKTRFVSDSVPSVSDVRRVKLELFGSSSQQTLQTSPNPSRPPRALYVNLTPIKSKLPTSSNSRPVRKMLYEPQSLSQSINTPNNKPMKQRKPTDVPSNHKELSDFSSGRLGHGKAKRLMSVKRKNAVRLGKGRLSILKRPDCDWGDAAFPTPVVPSPCEKDALKFSVLPESFTIKDRCRRSETPSDHVSDKPQPDSKDNMVGLTLKSTRENLRLQPTLDKWYPDSEKRSCPLSLPPIQKSLGLFTEFQKKYKEKMQDVLDV